MKTTLFARALFAASVLALTLFVSACDSTEPDEDDGAGEQELITRVAITMTPIGGGDALTIAAEDEDGPGGEAFAFDPEALVLQAGQTYNGAIELFDDVNDENITEEVEEEADEHLFRYTASDDLADQLEIVITDAEADYADDGRDGVPVGLTFQVEVTGGSAASGTLGVTLFHFDEGAVKEDGDSVSQERDIDINFPVEVATVVE